MSLKHIFRKYFIVTAGILFGFLFLANFTLDLIIRSTNERPPPIHSPLFFARLLDALGPDRIKNLKQMEVLDQSSLPFQFILLDLDGNKIAGQGNVDPDLWQSSKIPVKPLEFSHLGGNNDRTMAPPATFFPFPPSLRASHEHSPNETGGQPIADHIKDSNHIGQTGGPPRDQVIRLPNEPIQFLVVHFKPEEWKRPPRVQFFALSFSLLVLSVLVGVGVALSFIFRTLGKKVVLADTVIAELQRGNLKARFPIKKRDEFGAAMERFNQMADEIELLVERLVNTEKSRMKLLQELAHDLRTPVASLKNLLETLQTREATLESKVKTELISLSVKEIDYFERLIEDLLILAQVSEPRYQPKKDQTDLVAILIDESESAALHFSTLEKKISFIEDFKTDSLVTQGDSLLLRRMFRNVVQNAFSFARTQVKVRIEQKSSTHATIIVEDDGPGFSAEAIHSFGVRRVTRVLGSDQNGRLSVGLGSVIVKTVVELHRGVIQVENAVDSTGKVAGARVSFTLSLLA
jgi:signal transduction histidine kinase